MSNFWKSVGYTLLGLGTAYVIHRWPWAGPALAGSGVTIAGHMPGWSGNKE